MKQLSRRRWLAWAAGMAGTGTGTGLALAAPAGDPLQAPARRQRPDRPALLLDLAWAGARLVAVGEAGLVLFSDDQGVRWRQAEVPLSVTLTAVSFADAQRGWAVGHSGVVLTSSDGGASWRKQLDGFGVSAAVLRAATASGSPAWIRQAEQGVQEGADKAFFDVHVDADGRGWAVGAYGLALSSNDAAAGWDAVAPTTLPNPKGRHLYAIARQGDEVFFAGEQGLLLALREGAARPLASPYVGSWFGIVAGPGDALLAYGLRGHAFRSDDRGAHWQAVELGPVGSVMAGGRLRDGRLLLADETGRLLVGDAAAARFAPLPVAHAAYVSAWAECPDGSLVLAGARGIVRIGAPTLASRT